MNSVEQCRYCGVWGFPGQHKCEPRELTPLVIRQVADVTIPHGRRRDPRVLGDAKRDLELLAQWLPTILGRGMDHEPSIPGGKIDGRHDAVDQRHADLDDALRVMRRLCAIADENHAKALIYAYLVHGDDSRGRSDCIWGSFDAEIGLLFADKEQRFRWLSSPQKNVARSAAVKVGESIRVAALSSYRDVGEADAVRDALWVTDAVIWLAEKGKKVLQESREVKKALQKSMYTPMSRKQRRAATKASSV